MRTKNVVRQTASGLIMTKLFFLCLSCILPGAALSQIVLSRDSFFRPEQALPTHHKTLVADPNGWRVLGRYNCSNNNSEKHSFGGDTLCRFTPFREGKMFLKIRGDKIIGRGDRRAVSKIIFVSESRLIIESTWKQKRRGKTNRDKIRTLYRRLS